MRNLAVSRELLLQQCFGTHDTSAYRPFRDAQDNRYIYGFEFVQGRQRERLPQIFGQSIDEAADDTIPGKPHYSQIKTRSPRSVFYEVSECDARLLPCQSDQ